MRCVQISQHVFKCDPQGSGTLRMAIGMAFVLVLVFMVGRFVLAFR